MKKIYKAIILIGAAGLMISGLVLIKHSTKIIINAKEIFKDLEDCGYC